MSGRASGDLLVIAVIPTITEALQGLSSPVEISERLDPREIYTAKADGIRKTVPVIRPDALLLATATNQDGLFELPPIAEHIIRVAAYSVNELLYDGYLCHRDQGETRTIFVGEHLRRQSTFDELKQVLGSVSVRPFRDHLRRHIQGHPAEETEVAEVLQRALDASLDAERRRILAEVLPTFRKR